MRKKMEEEVAGQEPTTVESSLSSRACRRSWAALIRKVWDADPLKCKCGGTMKIISFIDEFSVVKRILTHLKLWYQPQNERPPPRLGAYSEEDYLQKQNPYADYYFLDVALGRN